MTYFKIARICFIATIFVSTVIATAHAQDPRFLSAYHSEYGLKLLNDKKYNLAVERFTKALLLDPQNQIAKESLQAIASEPSQTGMMGLRILRYVDQVLYIDFLTARFQSLVQENSRLRELLQNHQNFTADNDLSKKFHDIEAQINAKPPVLPQVSLIGFAGDESGTFDLETLTNRLMQERTDLAKEIGFWEEQNHQLRLVRKAVLFQNSAENPVLTAQKLQSQLEEVTQRVSQKDQLLSVQQQNIEYFKTELAGVRGDFNSLQEKFKATDVKITELIHKIASMSVEIVEKNNAIAQKEIFAASLQSDLGIANEKINLVQRIIQEKDDRISMLEKEMASVQVSAASSGHSPDAQVLKVQSDLKNFEIQFKDQMAKSRERLISLEFQYADLTSKYETLLEDTQVKDLQLLVLKDSVTQKTVLTNQYKEAFLQTDEKANQLIGMIEIYRGKLADVKKHLNSKEDELRQLQGALFDLHASPSAAQGLSHENQNDIFPPVIEIDPHRTYDLTYSQNDLLKNRFQAR